VAGRERVGGAIEPQHGKAAALRRGAECADGLLAGAHRRAGLGSKAVEAHGHHPRARGAAVFDARDHLLADEAALVEVDAAKLVHVGLVREGIAIDEVEAAARYAECDPMRLVGGRVEQLRADESPLWHLTRLEPNTREQELRDYLGGFDIRGDMATSNVERFSGGEKARLTLALIVRQRPNLLLLDEPTNHLDIEMREALTEALQDYGGALIVVAHDRHLLRATTDELWLVADGRVTPFDGDLDDYRAWVLDRNRRAPASDDRSSAPKPSADRRTQKREEAELRQRRASERKPLASRQASIEQDIERLTAEKNALDDWLATTEAYADDAKERLVTSIARQGELTWMLARLESEWLELADALDQLDV